MIENFWAVFSIINLQTIILVALLFFIGYVLAPTIYYKKVKWLTAYPFFIIHLMDKYFKKDWPALTIFIVIFCLNSISLFINLLSGWGILLPFILIIYTGLNIGVVMYHTLEGKFYYASLLNPVAILELPAAWISVAMGIQFGLNRIPGLTLYETISFGKYVDYFLYTVVPLLFIAAIIETVLIILARKHEADMD
jgi:uncharacterized membrane protein SpoIIM required for sporulation